MPALIRLHAAANSFRGDTLADLDVWLLDDHACLDWSSATAAIIGCQHPLTIGVGQLADRYDADSGLIIAALTWSKTDAPTRLEKSAIYRPRGEYSFDDRTYSQL